jgi:hypothetical protein
MNKAVLVSLVFTLFCFVACNQNISDFEYIVINSGIIITGYTGSSKDVKIPNKINNLPVVAIHQWAFLNKQLTSISLPKSLTSIGYASFEGNQLSSITLPENLDIQPNSFYYCLYDKYIQNNKKMSTFTISYSTINDFSIIVLDNSSVELIKYSGNVKELEIPNRINNINVTSIGDYVFVDKQLTSITLPNSLTYIGEAAFENNQLTSITFPNSLAYIGEVAFENNQLTSIILPSSVTFINDHAFSRNQLTSITLPDNVNIQPNSFYYCLYDKYIQNNKKGSTFSLSYSTVYDFSIMILDNSVVEIISFDNYVENLEIPNKINNLPVTSIGDSALSGIYLNSVILPNSITFIGNNAFSGNHLTSINLPNSITFIGMSAFSSNQLTNIDIPNSLTYIGELSFEENQLTSITLPNSITTIEWGTFFNNQLTSITIPGSITSIESDAFRKNQITDVVIPNSVKKLSDNAFDVSVKITRQ